MQKAELEEIHTRRLALQESRTLEANLEDLPQGCDWVEKRDIKGNAYHWRGYKLHLSIGNGGVPLKYMTIKTVKTEVITSEEPTAETLDCMKSVSSSIPTAAAISAMDGKTLAKSGKMVLFYLTEVVNTGMELSGDRVTLKNLGKLPPSPDRQGRSEAQACTRKAIHALSAALGWIPAQRDPATTKDGITEINLDTAKLPDGPAFYFELEGK